VDAAVDYFEAQGLVGIDRHFVIDPRVGGYLETALLASPVFRGAHQGSANSLLSRCLLDEPALNETDRLCGVAAVGVGAQADLQKSGQAAIFAFGDKDCHGESAVSSGVKDCFEFFAMIFGGGIGPEETTHRGELVLVGDFALPDPDGHAPVRRSWRRL
jgi:hypothetical protein